MPLLYGLKPVPFMKSVLYGTTEVVPFQNLYINSGFTLT